MKRRLLHLGIAGPPVINASAVEAVLNGMSDMDWLRIGPHVWVLYTNRPIDEIRVNIHGILQLKDAFMLFSSFNPEHASCNGWLPEWVWDWLRSKPL
jgi:hypothetical protein